MPKEVKEKPRIVRELGSTGTLFFGGFISGEEYNTKLLGLAGLNIYDEMRNDSQVAATLTAITLPIIQAVWKVIPFDQEKENIEIAKFVEYNLFNMRLTWSEFIRQTLIYIYSGFMVFEKVWAIEKEENNLFKGKVILKNLSPRLPKTIYKWFVEENGELIKIQQYVKKGEKSFEYIDIPSDKIVVFTNMKEGSNYIGKSILRSAYRPWYIKSTLVKIDAIRHDRWGIGIPRIKLPENCDPDSEEYERAKTIAQNLRAHEMAYVLEPFGYEIDLISMPEGSGTDIITSVKFHNEEIAKNVLAQFLSLGSTTSGSRNLGENFQSFFLLSIHAIVNYIIDNLNKFVIKQLVDFNFNTNVYPSLNASKIETGNFSRVADAVTKLVGGGIITNDDSLESHIRHLGRLPQLPEGVENREKKEDKNKQLPDDTNNVNPSNVNGKLDNIKVRLNNKVGVIIEEQIPILIKDAKINDNINMKKKGYLASVIKGELLEAYRLGKRENKEEGNIIEIDNGSYFKNNAELWVSNVSDLFICKILRCKKRGLDTIEIKEHINHFFSDHLYNEKNIFILLNNNINQAYKLGKLY